MTILYVPTLEEQLDHIRLAPPAAIQSLLCNAIEPTRLPLGFLDTLGDMDRITASRACLLAAAVTGGTQIPWELQLQACLATYHGRDSLSQTQLLWWLRQHCRGLM